MKVVGEGDSFCMQKEAAPLRSVDLAQRILENRPASPVCTGDRGILLGDVYDGRADMEDFLAQLTDEDLACIVWGEGMCSPKVTPGTAGAFGGVTDRLQHFGIPAGCCADGPSGIRMDCGHMPSACLTAPPSPVLFMRNWWRSCRRKAWS